MTKSVLPILVLTLCATLLSAQRETRTLSRNADLNDYLLIDDLDKSVPGINTISEMPPGPMRSMAEWEELQGLMITWRNQHIPLYIEIVRNAREECNVVICVSNQNILNTAQNQLVNAGVDISSNVQFVVVPNNSIWIRDYGANPCYLNEVDSLYMIDWIYNRNRPLDDDLSNTVAAELNLPIISTTEAPLDLVHTGGNFMSDGMGLGMSSQLFLEENGPNNQFGISNHDEAAVDSIMEIFMGINRYPKFENLPYDVIHHIDMHMKILDEETILFGQYPQGIADGPQIEANIQFLLSNFKTSFGTDFDIIRIPMPPENGFYPNFGGDYRTYANAVFVNKTILVPFYEEQYDTTAQRIWQEAMPGYNVVGINCNTIIPSLGAIHCITKEIGVNDPLRIVHQKLRDVTHFGDQYDYPVHAKIQHRSGVAGAKVFYTTEPDFGFWSTINMSPYNPMDTSDVWVADLPYQAGDTTLYYYIEAEANSGKTIQRPLTAPDGYWQFKVNHLTGVQELEDNTAMHPVYPNPASAITCIPIESERPTQTRIDLVNALGQQVEMIFEGKLPSGKSNYFFDASRYPAGIYFVRMSTSKEQIQQKVVIK